MSSLTSRLGLYKPDDTGSENINVTTDINNNLDNLDSKVGALACTSGARPGAPYNGQFIRETDTGKMYVHDGTNWRQLLFHTAQFANQLNLASGILAGGEIRNTQAAAANRAFVSRLTGDADDRLRIESDGAMHWGDGTAATDVSLYRFAGSGIRVTGDLNVDLQMTCSDLVVNGNPLFTDGYINLGGARYNTVLSGTSIVSNTTTETSVGTVTIPANSLVAGAVYRVKVMGLASVTGAPTLTMRLRIGGTGGSQLITSGTITASSGVQNKPIEFEAYFTCLSTGASGNHRAWARTTETLSLATNNGPTTSSVSRLDSLTFDLASNTTIDRDLVATVQWGTASSSNTFIALVKTMERVA